MNISRENIDDLNAVLKIEVEKNDYTERVEKVLRDYRKKANIKGFRPGMVPIGLIRKLYGTSVRIDEINKLVSEKIKTFLTEEKIEILGDPLPKSDDKIDFDNQESFIFSFEVGLKPDFDLKLTKKNKLASYNILIDKKMKDDYLDSYKRRFGDLRNVETTEETDTLKGKIEAVDEKGDLLSGGPANEDSSLNIDIIKDKKIQKQFTGKKVNESIDFDLNKAFPNEIEKAGILGLKKEEVSGIKGSFRFTINEITRFFPAEMGKELFDKIYGKDVIKTKEEFLKKVEEEIKLKLNQESLFKLKMDAKELASEKTEINLPEEFLKKWLVRTNENTTPEQIDKEFDSFTKDLRWQLIKNKVARDNDLKITEEELMDEARNITRNQFQQYGLLYADEEQITNYAKETLKREDDAKRIADQVIEEKVVQKIMEMVKIEDKNVSAEQFNKLFE